MVKKMFNEFVIIKQDEAAKEIGGIELLSALDHPQSGTVMASFDEEVIPVGIRIAHQRGAAQPVVLEGEPFGILRKVDIICEL